MSGLYVYNGEFAGIYSRLSTGGIISSQYNERAVATLVVQEEAPCGDTSMAMRPEMMKGEGMSEEFARAE